MESFYKVREFSTVREMLDQSFELFHDRNAFEIKDKDSNFRYIKYSEYERKINGLITALIYGGYGGKKIAICADNCYEYCMTYLSVICAGSVIVPIDKELKTPDIRGIIDVSDCEVLVCDRKFLDAHGKDTFSDMRLLLLRKPEDEYGDIESFDDFVREGIELNNAGKRLYLDVKQDPEKLCTLLFTSGTTGVSKGVMLCQRNFVFEIRSAMGVVKIYPEDCGISMLPLHHTFESSIMIFFAVYCGAKVTFCEGFKYVLRNMKEFNPSVFVAVPLLLETVHKRIMKAVRQKKNGLKLMKAGMAVCKAASKVNIDLRKVFFREIQETFGGNMRLIICGGAPIDPQIIKDFDAFGIQIIFGYGLTECAPLAIINHDRLHSTDSVGKPLPGTQAVILNPDENGIGELCVKGDMVMLGYYKNKEATDEVIDKNGFFHTGDLAFIDKKGNYHITGRCKNVIVTLNGKNIYPEELEYHLAQSDFVSSCMVEGVDDDRGDLVIRAQIFPDKTEIKEFLDKEPTREEIKAIIKKVVDNVNNSVPGFKRIKSFLVRENDFVMTTTQKIKRTANSTVKKK
ncbi:MAG: AMP-binding protein [Clostridia bacterium]|nr:AMP-binding protein [Clostridia bacterium]